eukprot:TRINITY_DN115612_c0_g1_i1.p1 TRINITY_DN115612_c0_g1~~TRINITY_DN115612_c0_g1_i1.p1  ORF type:complete len:242 (-),score=39.04 TRINITY_DN115612_c0_g1_i1:362-1087(-)
MPGFLTCLNKPKAVNHVPANRNSAQSSAASSSNGFSADAMRRRNISDVASQSNSAEPTRQPWFRCMTVNRQRHGQTTARGGNLAEEASVLPSLLTSTARGGRASAAQRASASHSDSASAEKTKVAAKNSAKDQGKSSPHGGCKSGVASKNPKSDGEEVVLNLRGRPGSMEVGNTFGPLLEWAADITIEIESEEESNHKEFQKRNEAFETPKTVYPSSPSSPSSSSNVVPSLRKKDRTSRRR